MMSLTLRQQDALRFIVGYQEANGVPPLLKEIQHALACRSLYVAFWLVQQLEQRGAIDRSSSGWRAINVLHPIAIPRAPDGEPLHFIRIGECA